LAKVCKTDDGAIERGTGCTAAEALVPGVAARRREMDLIVGRFADVFIDRFDDAALDDFEQLIEAPNAALYAWVVGDEAAPQNYDTAVLRQLIAFHAQNFAGKAGEGT
jgi:succinate dehydrogenase flavin-adding protein (antitoxin of CptAB toxin-antitoxin module)